MQVSRQLLEVGRAAEAEAAARAAENEGLRERAQEAEEAAAAAVEAAAWVEGQLVEEIGSMRHEAKRTAAEMEVNPNPDPDPDPDPNPDPDPLTLTLTP